MNTGCYLTRGGLTVLVEDQGDGLPFIVRYRARTWTVDAKGRTFPSANEPSEWDILLDDEDHEHVDG